MKFTQLIKIILKIEIRGIYVKETVIAIVGPTAVGKTKLSIDLAKNLQGEIISGDSMQVYKGMNIGTGKITETEKEDIPHYMLNIIQPKQSFSVAEFQQSVRTYIDKITSKIGRAHV